MMRIILMVSMMCGGLFIGLWPRTLAWSSSGDPDGTGHQPRRDHLVSRVPSGHAHALAHPLVPRLGAPATAALPTGRGPAQSHPPAVPETNIFWFNLSRRPPQTLPLALCGDGIYVYSGDADVFCADHHGVALYFMW